jgi:hypothetical protein
MDPDFEPTYTMYCGDGGDGGGDGGGDASSPGDTGGAGGDDGAGGNDAGGASGGTSGGDAPSPGDTGGAGGDPSDPGSEASGGGGGSTDTGDLGSEAANVAATESANASVGAGGSGVSTGFAPSPAEVSLADISAEEAAAAGLGVTAVDPGIPTETIKSYTQNLQAQMKSNPIGFALSPVGTMAMVAAQTIAANTMMGGVGTGTGTGVGSSTDPFGTISGGGDADTLTATIAPYLLGNTQAQPSQVLQYFSNLQNQPQAEGLLSRYDQAKQNISGILGTNNQLGASNTSNFYYNYLNQRGLL